MSEPPKLTQVKCKASASLLPNNLVYNGRYYGYMSRNEVHLVDHKPNLFEVEKAEKVIKCSYAEKDPVSSIDQAALKAGSVLLVANTVGMLLVCDETGEKPLHSHKLQKSQVALSAKDAYLRGIANDGVENIFLGSGSGDVLLFTLTSKLSLSKKVATSFSRAIWAVHYDQESKSLIAADDAGNLSVFSCQPGTDTITKAWDCKGSGSPVTSIASGHGCIVTADVTGKLRVYSMEKRGLSVEICAHARIINAVAVHPRLPMLVSVSEDTYLSVWSLPTATQPAVRNLLMFSPAPALLTGVTFSGKNGEAIVCTIYDSKSLFSMPTPAL